MPIQYFPITGRILITETGTAAVILDTNDSMLCVNPADVEVGSVVVPARTASSSGVDGVQTVVDVVKDYYIATLEIPGANVVRGMMRSTWASNPEPADNLWRQASGTHLDIVDGVSQTTVPQNDLGGYNRVASLGGYTFFVNELGHLVLRERIVMRARDAGSPPTQFNRARRQATISFRLLVGFFLGGDFVRRPGLKYLGQKAQFNTGASYTLTDVPGGYVYPNRRIVGVVHAVRDGGTGRTPSSVKFNGITCDIHATVESNSGIDSSVAIVSALVPAGEEIDVALVFPTAPTSLQVELFALANANNLPVVDTTSGVGASANRSVAVGDQGIGLAVNTMRSSQNSLNMPTWSNAAMSTYGWFFNNAFQSTAIIPKNTNAAVTVTWPSSGDQSFATAVWNN